MSETASAGAITINLQLNLAPLEAGVKQANAQLGSISGIVEKQFAAAGGSIGNFGEKIGGIGKAFKKMFGDDAPKVLQDFGKEMANTIGLSDSQVKGLAQSVEALEGAFKLVGLAITSGLVGPIGVALLMFTSIGLAVESFLLSFDKMKGMGKNGGSVWNIDTQNPDQGPIKLGNSLKGGGGSHWWDGIFGGGAKPLVDVGNSMNGGPGVEGEKPFSFDIAGTLKASGTKLAKDISDALGGISKLLEPGVKATKAKASPKSDLSAVVKSMYDDEAKIREGMYLSMSDGVDKINEQTRKQTEGLLESSRDLWEYQKEQDKKRAEYATKITEEEIEILQNEAAKRASKWQAVGSGQFGTAFGMTGTAGAAFNIAGGAIAGAGPNTSAVLSGASQGGEAGGPWGALIGAIVALMTKTQSFAKILEMIEGVLGDILPLLDQILRPIMDSLKGAFQVLTPILKLFGKLAEMLNGVISPLEAMTDMIGELMSAIGGLVDMIGSVSIGMEGGTGGGKASGNGGSNEFGISWLTMEAEFKALGEWIGTWNLNGQSDPVAGAKYSKYYFDNKGQDALAEWDGRDRGSVDASGKRLSSFKDEADFNDALKRYRAALQEEADKIATKSAVQTALAEFGTTIQNTKIALRAMADPIYKIVGYAAYAATRDRQAAEEKQTAEWEAAYNATHNLTSATDKATDALQTFSDSLINAAPGYRLALSGYNAQGAGGPQQQMGASLGMGGGINVIIDGQSVAYAIERRSERSSQLGSAFAGRVSAFAGG